MYSSIQKKYGKCIDCSSNEPEQYIIAKRCPNHYKIYRAKIQLEKQKTRNKVRSLHSLPDNRSMVEKKIKYEIDEKLEQWFLDRRKDMTGFCWCGCSKLSSKNDDKYFKFSACHLLAKSKFKSIMYHPLNFVELNFWEGHHTTFDNMGYEYCKNTKPMLWKIVVERFKILYPFIAPEEHKFIPQVLLETLK